MENDTFTGVMTDSMVDDLFSGGPDVSASTTQTTQETTDPVDPESPDPVESEGEPETAAEPAVEPEEIPTGEPKKDAAAEAEDLPEGVTVRERNGKKEWVYTEERGRSIYGGYKLAQEAEQIIGEPLSTEALVNRQMAHEWLDSQRVDSLSANPADQSNVFRNIFREAAVAITNGDIGHDPLATMGEAFMTSLAEVAPEHFEATQNFVMQGVLEKLYAAAAENGSEKLLRSAQNLDHHLNGKYRDDAEVKKQSGKVAPIDKREQSLNQREQQILNHQRAQQRASFNNWHKSTTTSISNGVQAVRLSQISPEIKAAFETAPGGAQRLANIDKLLDFEVRDGMRKDLKWAEGNTNLFRQAEMAPSEQKRQAIQTQIVQRYEQKARQIVQAKAKTIIDAETVGIKAANTATHKKLQAGQQQKGGSGAAPPATRHIPSNLPSNASWDDFLNTVG